MIVGRNVYVYLFQSFRGSSSNGLDLNGYDDCCCGADLENCGGTGGYSSPGEPPFSEIFQSNLISLIRGGKYCSFIVVSSIIQL